MSILCFKMVRTCSLDMSSLSFITNVMALDTYTLSAEDGQYVITTKNGDKLVDLAEVGSNLTSSVCD